MWLRLGLALLIALIAAACAGTPAGGAGTSGAGQALTIYGAASLTEVLGAVKASYEERDGKKVATSVEVAE